MAETLTDIIKTRWINPRRKRFWAIAAVLFYTLFGFFAAPPIVEKIAIDFVREDLGRTAVIEKIEVNPYVMSLRVQGFEMDDSDGVRLAAFDEFFINFQLSSLFNWAWTFEEIRLTGSYFLFERFDPQSSRLSNLLTDLPKDQQAEGSKEEEGGVPRLLIHNLSLSEGRIDVKDNVPETVVETSLAPINILIQSLNTLPDRHGEQSVTIQLPGDATLKWGGSLALAPLGAWIAVRGSFEGDLRPVLLLAAAVWSWVAGFDLIYACQDAEFDRASGLHSVPARFGVGRALTLARVLHLVTVACLVAFTASADLSWIYWTAVGGAAILLAWEHSLVAPDDLSRVNVAFFTLNGWVGVALFVGLVLDMQFLGGGGA